MEAAGAVERFPSVRLDDDVLSAIRLVLQHGLLGLTVVDERGEVVGCLSLLDLLRLVLPGYLREQPHLARTFDEENADRIAAPLVGVRIGDVMGEVAGRVPVVGPRATVVELAEQMEEHRCPLVLVRKEAGGVLGVVTVNRVLQLLANEAGPSR